MKELQAIKTILYMAVWSGSTQGNGNSLHERAKG